MSSGHVFVIRGDIQDLDVDAAIISAGRNFNLRDSWARLFPNAATMPERGKYEPKRWKQDGFGASAVPEDPGGTKLFFLNVSEPPGESLNHSLLEVTEDPKIHIENLISNFAKLVAVIDESGVEPKNGRSRALVATPLLGTGNGGLNSSRGILISELLKAATKATENFLIDIVIVARDAQSYSAIQAVRQRIASRRETPLLQKAKHLALLARQGKLAVLIAAGVSMSAGLPSWDGLMRALHTANSRVTLSELGELNALEAAGLLQSTDKYFRQHLVELIEKKEKAGLSHAILATIGCQYTVTTNFDCLYELAVSGANDGPPLAVLPWGNAGSDDGAWLMKLHGDVKHPNSIVLAREDFVLYDTQMKPSASMLQSLMLTHHLMIVGASMTDPNFLRLAHEVKAFLTQFQSEKTRLGTVVTIKDENAMAQVFRNIFEYVSTDSGDLGGTCAPSGNAGRARNLAIFLDAIALFAADTTAFLLDPRFEGLLEDTDTQMARSVIDITRGLPAGANSPWNSLIRLLESYGLNADKNQHK